MARTIRSEASANQAMYLASVKPQARDDWRAILAKRDQKRTARHYRQARRPLIGAAGMARIGAILFACGLGVSCAAALFLSLSAYIGIGMYSRQGGTRGEFAIEWREICGAPTPQLQVFDDAWGVLPQFSDVIDGLARIGRHAGAEDVCAMLLACGLEDLTARTQPA